MTTSQRPRLVSSLTLAATLIAGITAGVPVVAQNRPGADVTGAWIMTVEMSMGVSSPTVDLKQDGSHISGIYVSRYGDYPVTGSIAGRIITFSITMRPDDPVTITYTGELSPDGRQMKGTADLGEMGDATWHAERSKERGPGFLRRP